MSSRCGTICLTQIPTSSMAVGDVLVREEGKKQYSVYYRSKTLEGAELRYQPEEKFLYAILIATRNLRLYFQTHQVTVLTDQVGLKDIARSPKASRRISRWAMELTKYNLLYKPRRTIKAQTLIDFVVECPISKEEFDKAEAERENDKRKKTSNL